MFYEQNNIASFKQIFINQFLFAVKAYLYVSPNVTFSHRW